VWCPACVGGTPAVSVSSNSVERADGAVGANDPEVRRISPHRFPTPTGTVEREGDLDGDRVEKLLGGARPSGPSCLAVGAVATQHPHRVAVARAETVTEFSVGGFHDVRLVVGRPTEHPLLCRTDDGEVTVIGLGRPPSPARIQNRPRSRSFARPRRSVDATMAYSSRRGGECSLDWIFVGPRRRRQG
jgi:hypothetical protein